MNELLGLDGITVSNFKKGTEKGTEKRPEKGTEKGPGLCKKVGARLREKFSPLTASPVRPCQAGA